MTDNLRAASQGDMRNPRLAKPSANKRAYFPYVGKAPKGVDDLLKSRQPTEWIVDLLALVELVSYLLVTAEQGKHPSSIKWLMPYQKASCLWDN